MAERIELSEIQVRMLRHIDMGSLLPGRGGFTSIFTRAGLDAAADLWSMGLVEMKYGSKARITPAGRIWLKEHGHG